MRLFNLVAILALGRVSAEVSNAVAPNLRGSEPKVDEDRDLATVSGSKPASFSKSSSFSFNCCYRGNYCLDMHAYCMRYSTTDSGTQTISNSVAESEFYAAAVCGALADAHACSIACIRAKGKINLDATADSTYGMSIDLKMKLNQATLTVAKASSEAEASAYSSAAGQVYTETDGDFCGGEGKGSPQCSPGAVKALANASALVLGDAFAMADASASSGTSSKIAAWVNAKGSSIKQVSAFVTTVAQSWSFAAASTSALASVFVTVLANATAISLQCGKAYEMYCSTGECHWQNQTEACSAAIAFGSGNGTAYAQSCANASASAVASTKVVMTFGGQISGLENDGTKLTVNFPNGKRAARGAAAAICPGK